jgi:type IV pilus assembly protein PilZ
VKGGAAINGHAKDISIGGMFIESDAQVSFGLEVTISLRLPNTKANSRLPGVVRWIKPGGFGVQFGLLGARETHAISELFKS